MSVGDRFFSNINHVSIGYTGSYFTQPSADTMLQLLDARAQGAKVVTVRGPGVTVTSNMSECGAPHRRCCCDVCARWRASYGWERT
jgi:hypothetical protein